MEVAKRGQLISWEYKGVVYIEPIASVDVNDKCYCVYVDYAGRQDKIPFEVAEIVIDNVN